VKQKEKCEQGRRLSGYGKQNRIEVGQFVGWILVRLEFHPGDVIKGRTVVGVVEGEHSGK
jgi:hypothetical protein